MTKTWRPDNWDKTRDAILLQHKGQFMRPETLIEKGADAMLESLTPCGRLNWDVLNDISNRLQVEHIKQADPREDAEDKEHVENWHKNTEKEQLMICPLGKDCHKYSDGFCTHQHKHKFNETSCYLKGSCAVCIPYEPEKETDWENLWAFFRDNKATRVIEKGYFCPTCGAMIPRSSGHMILTHVCPEYFCNFTNGN